MKLQQFECFIHTGFKIRFTGLSSAILSSCLFLWAAETKYSHVLTTHRNQQEQQAAREGRMGYTSVYYNICFIDLWFLFLAIRCGHLKTWKNCGKPTCVFPDWWCITHFVFSLCWCSTVNYSFFPLVRLVSSAFCCLNFSYYFYILFLEEKKSISAFSTGTAQWFAAV